MDDLVIEILRIGFGVWGGLFSLIMFSEHYDKKILLFIGIFGLLGGYAVGSIVAEDIHASNTAISTPITFEVTETFSGQNPKKTGEHSNH